jgi:hypothetical protein
MQELQKMHQKVNLELGQIEKDIFNMETEYLKESAALLNGNSQFLFAKIVLKFDRSTIGNIFKGWEGIQNNTSKPGYANVGNRNNKQKITMQDRLFSFSSLSCPYQDETDFKCKSIASTL